MNTLERILADKRAEVARRRVAPPPRAAARPAGLPALSAALRAPPIALIAEVKRRSPSAGVLRDPWDPAGLARAYEAAGARAVSVVVDETHFGGGPGAFLAARAAVGLPMLFKEFVLDPWQVEQAAGLGASAVLLIAAALEPARLADLSAATEAMGMEALVEVHDEAELEAALAAGASLVGINNRDLRTFQVSLDTTLRLRTRVPPQVTLVSESGIRTPDDVRRLTDAGVHAVLVGEALLRSADAGAAARRLMSGVAQRQS